MGFMPGSLTTDGNSTGLLPASGRQRLDGIDMLRGLVMVVMALDHTRDYFTNAFYDPVDLTKTNPALFLTRWVTHYCAPVFIFLAGTGAFLYASRGKSKKQLAWFLVTRGIWLVFLEVTLIRLSWMFNWDPYSNGAGVFWSIGWSMVLLAPLVFLPTSAVAAYGVIMIALHNTMDNLRFQDVGLPEWLWPLLHDFGFEVSFKKPDSSEPLFVFGCAYKIIPWAGVMAAGYAFGAFYYLDSASRRKQLYGLGAALTLAFFGLRASNVYGDASRWTLQKDNLFTFLSFLNCTKYPPSLHYLLMTLGPAIMALALFDKGVGVLGRPFVVFGRVPLFFYLLHIPLIHGLAVLVDYQRFGWSPMAFNGPWVPKVQVGYGFDLAYVYLIWLGVVVFLYPFCFGYARFKQKHSYTWLSYL